MVFMDGGRSKHDGAEKDFFHGWAVWGRSAQESMPEAGKMAAGAGHASAPYQCPMPV
jgi:hypothetical protein